MVWRKSLLWCKMLGEIESKKYAQRSNNISIKKKKKSDQVDTKS